MQEAGRKEGGGGGVGSVISGGRSNRHVDHWSGGGVFKDRKGCGTGGQGGFTKKKRDKNVDRG